MACPTRWRKEGHANNRATTARGAEGLAAFYITNAVLICRPHGADRWTNADMRTRAVQVVQGELQSMWRKLVRAAKTTCEASLPTTRPASAAPAGDNLSADDTDQPTQMMHCEDPLATDALVAKTPPPRRRVQPPWLTCLAQAHWSSSGRYSIKGKTHVRYSRNTFFGVRAWTYCISHFRKRVGVGPLHPVPLCCGEEVHSRLGIKNTGF